MDTIDRKLLVEAEKGLSLSPQPFEQIAATIGITPQEVIFRLQKLQESGVIRRFGVSIKPNSVGFCANALVAWQVPNDRMLEVSKYFCERKEVSHCYEREVVSGKWEYNLYTVMHAHERSTVENLVKQFSIEVAIDQWVILFSTRNLKAKETREC